MDTDLLKTRQHFELLDGLRGIAALAVVIFHFMEMVYADYSKNFIGHGFLAVDFFFCLSGFVIAYAYDGRIAKMGIAEFFTSRVIRLHPLVILGSVLGLIGFLFDPFASYQLSYSTGRILMLFITSLLLIPFPVMPERFFNLFSFNAPAWSLFWEYVANIVYAFFLYKIKRGYLFVFTVVAAVLLCVISYRSQSLMGGWGKDTFKDGGARVLYSFLAGMLIYRSGWIIRSRIGFVGLSILLALAFTMPWTKWNWLTELLVVLFCFPLIVSLGAGGKLANTLRKLCVLFGKISYPLYMTHYAALWIFFSYYNTHKPAGIQLFLIIFSSVVLLLLFAYVVMIVYDIPVRKYLNRKRVSG
ncbi:MAG: acyltransferase [Agriterribacter sp.]